MQFALQPAPLFARLFGRTERRPVTRWFAAHVRHGATREIPHLAGRCMTVHCRRGQAWITHDGDPRDVVLQAEQCYRVDSGSRMTLHAMHGDCVLEIQVDD